jgi:hypothetical protein
MFFKDPTGIFTNGESSFQLCPKTGNVLANRGDKNMCEFYRGLAKASITAVLAFSAFGMCPPMLRWTTAVLEWHRQNPSKTVRTCLG